MREEHLTLAGHELVISRPDDPESLIDESRFDENEFLPYWAELWPSGIALARYLAERDLRGTRVLEVGCGLALPSLAAALVGADVLATDWAPEAIELVMVNAAANGLDVTATVLDWTADRPLSEPPFDLVLAADVLYEERNAGPLLRLLQDAVAPGGDALMADPGRRHAAAFFDGASAAGWSIENIRVDGLPAGGIVKLRRGHPGDSLKPVTADP
jgi:predicted nicotinamide N-methyase